MLLVAALLFVRTFRNLINLDAGFRQDNILVADFDFSPLKVLAENRLEYKRKLLDKVRNTPGVLSAAETSVVPLNGDGWNEFIDVPTASISRKLVYFNGTTTKYFRTLQIPMIAGRDFSENDICLSARGGRQPAVRGSQLFPQLSTHWQNLRDQTKWRKAQLGLPHHRSRRRHKVRDLHDDAVPIIFVDEYQIADPGTDSTFLVHSNVAPSALIASLKDSATQTDPAIVLNFSVLRTSVLEKLTREPLDGHAIRFLRSSPRPSGRWSASTASSPTW